MTVAVAVKKGDRIVLAADSLVNFGGQRYHPSNCRFRKIHLLGDSVIAWAGWSLYAELLAAHLQAAPPPTLNNEGDVFSFFIRFWRMLKEEYNMRGPNSDADHPFADLYSTFLLVNRNGLFRVSSDMDVTEFQEYAAVGSGSKYALGALRVLYGESDDVGEIATRAVQVGIDFDVYCGGTIDVVDLNQETMNAPETIIRHQIRMSGGPNGPADASPRSPPGPSSPRR
jgi:ATP-dependent protease HslVU (ClpYQ) peptidase subunit